MVTVDKHDLATFLREQYASVLHKSKNLPEYDCARYYMIGCQDAYLSTLGFIGETVKPKHSYKPLYENDLC